MTAFNHLTGILDPAGRTDLPAVTAWAGDPLRFDDVEIIHATFELLMAETLQCLPRAVHPSIPGHLSILVIRAQTGPLGPFTLAQFRVGCRAGVKRRAFCLAAVTDSPLAARTLSDHWVDGHRVLGLAVTETRPLAGTTVSYPATLNLGATPGGPCLLQADSDVELGRVERGISRLTDFDLSPWPPRLSPQQPVAATVATGTMVLQPARPA